MKLIINLSDNGKLFNPVTYQPEENFATDGVTVLKYLAKKLSTTEFLA